MYTRNTRPLNEKEARTLRLSLSANTKQKRLVFKRSFITGPLIFGVLWGLTLLTARDWSIGYVTLFWVLIGTPIGIAAGADAIRPLTKRIAGIEDALANGKADEACVSSGEMVELAEIEDLGACYAFQVEPDKILFVSGQDYYPGSKFPSTEFSIVRILGTKNTMVDLMIDKRGEKLRPSRTISVEAQKRLRWPEHLEVITGTLDRIEEILKKPPTDL